MADGNEDLPRLAAVIERLRDELTVVRAEADVAAVIAMARGVLMERQHCSAAEAARQLTDMTAAAGLPPHEMAAAVLRQEPPGLPPEPGQAHRLEPHDPIAVAAAERARDGAELVDALSGQLRDRLGAAAVAVWLLESDGSLEMLGQAGLGGTDASRWRRLPAQFDSPQQRVARTGEDLWWPAGPPADDPVPVVSPWGGDAASAILALRDRTGTLLGVVQAWWTVPWDHFDENVRATLSAAVAGFAEVLSLRLAYGPVGSTAPSPVVFKALDQIADSVLLVRPLRDPHDQIADFAIVHLSPGYADPAGRPAASWPG